MKCYIIAISIIYNCFLIFYPSVILAQQQMLQITEFYAANALETVEDLDSLMDGFDVEEKLSNDFRGGTEKQTGYGASSSKNQNIGEGFEKESEEKETHNPISSHQNTIFKYFSFDGYCKIASTYNFAHDKPQINQTDWRGVSKLRAELQLELTSKFASFGKTFINAKGFYDLAYQIKGRGDFTDDVIDNYEKEIELREAYLLASPCKNCDVKIGRQIVVWGKSDNIRVTDVLNPLDMREPGLTDIEDLRLPMFMSRIDYYFTDWNITGILIPELRFNKNPEFGSDFYPQVSPPASEIEPLDWSNDTEFAVAFNGIFSGWDLAIYYAKIYNDIPHLESKSLMPAIQFELHHARLNMIGVAYNIALGNWLLKTEAAFLDGLTFFNTGKEKDFSRIDVLLGAEYSGLTNTTVSLEAVNRHINDFDSTLKLSPDGLEQDDFQTVFRIERDFLNETLKITLLASILGTDAKNGSMQRYTAEYEIMDAFTILGGLAIYESGDKTSMRNVGQNDRFFVELKFSF